MVSVCKVKQEEGRAADNHHGGLCEEKSFEYFILNKEAQRAPWSFPNECSQIEGMEFRICFSLAPSRRGRKAELSTGPASSHSIQLETTSVPK